MNGRGLVLASALAAAISGTAAAGVVDHNVFYPVFVARCQGVAYKRQHSVYRAVFAADHKQHIALFGDYLQKPTERASVLCAELFE